jgi:hypothetical protein
VCHEVKPDFHFSARHSNPDGLATICRACDAERHQKYIRQDQARRAMKRWNLSHFEIPGAAA